MTKGVIMLWILRGETDPVSPRWTLDAITIVVLREKQGFLLSCLTLDLSSGLDFRVMSSSPALGSMLGIKLT